jgi:RNA polymerase sigma-70 factor, ECF subfamily
VKLESRIEETMADNSSVTNSNHEKLYRVISRLTDIDKAIITLYLEGFSYKEIAEIIGISESNTGAKINRIKSVILKSFDNGNK